LYVAILFITGKELTMVGDIESGYIVAPYCAELSEEMEASCQDEDMALDPNDWIHTFSFVNEKIPTHIA
jgi:hypothetical protein